MDAIGQKARLRPRGRYSALALGYLGGILPYRVGVDDTFMQLLMGSYYLAHGFFTRDPFTYATPVRAIYDHEWLVSIAFALLYQWWGSWGLLAYKVITMTVCGVALVHTAKTEGASDGACILVGGAFLLLFFSRSMTRPHLLGECCLALLLLLLSRDAHGPSRRLWWAVPLLWVWSQTHGSFVLGCAFLGLDTAIRRERRLLLVLAACLLISLCGPNTWHAFAFPFAEMHLEHALGAVYEWRSPADASERTLLWPLFVGMLATLWWGFGRQWPPWLRTLSLGGWLLTLAIFGAPPHMSLPTKAVVTTSVRVGLWGEIALLAVMVIRNKSQWRLGARILCATILAALYMRAVLEVALLVCAPLAASGLRAGREHRRRVLGSALALLMPLLWLLLVSRDPMDTIWAETVIGVGLNIPRSSDCVARVVRGMGLAGHLLSVDNGGYYAWALWPALRVFDDPRRFVYGAPLLIEYLRALSDPVLLQKFVERTTTTMIVARWRVLPGHVVAPLIRQGWRVAVMTDDLYLLVNAQVAQTVPIYAHILAIGSLPVTLYNASSVLLEAQRARTQCPEASQFAWAYMRDALTLLGR